MTKVTGIPIACFIFRLFILNAIFFSSLVVAYVCFKVDAPVSERIIIIDFFQFFNQHQPNGKNIYKLTITLYKLN